MTWFEVTDESEATVAAGRQEVWDVLTDPEALVRMTPFLQSIDVDGDHWTWRLGVIKALGNSVAPSFTERMRFEDLELIEFDHDPAEPDGETAGVDGSYRLSDADDGATALAISFTVRVRLPLPRAAKIGVHTAMRGVLARMGDGFGRNLTKELAR